MAPAAEEALRAPRFGRRGRNGEQNRDRARGRAPTGGGCAALVCGACAQGDRAQGGRVGERDDEQPAGVCAVPAGPRHPGGGLLRDARAAGGPQAFGHAVNTRVARIGQEQVLLLPLARPALHLQIGRLVRPAHAAPHPPKVHRALCDAPGLAAAALRR
eukprot:4475809-Prymnesium_polylepis.1